VILNLKDLLKMAFNRRKHRERLERLREELGSGVTEVQRSPELDKMLANLNAGRAINEKLSLAGFLTIAEQTTVKRLRLFVVISITLISASIAFSIWRIPGLIGGLIFGLYLGLVVYSIYIALLKAATIRKVYYELPLLLEELVLLVESGLALFPALEEICRNSGAAGDRDNSENKSLSGRFRFFGQSQQSSVARRLLGTAYRLAAYGMPISEAFEQVAKIAPFPVLRQVLLHLDISSSVGGELLHSLRTLSEQVHREWKLAVETRVKRLENFVVFPVFVSVMGLMLLASAVPMVPILEFMSSMNSKKQVSALSGSPDLGSSDNFNKRGMGGGK